MNNLDQSIKAWSISICSMEKYLMIIFLNLISFTSFGQSQHFYGHIPDYTYLPDDLIQLENGNLIIIGSSSHVESNDVTWFFNQYIVEINRQGDTMWTSHVPHGKFRFSNVIEKTGNDGIIVWGAISNQASCNGYYWLWGFKHYYVRIYDEKGLLINTSTFADACDTEIVQFFKDDNSLGGLTRIKLLGSSDYLYSIKQIDREGNLKHIDIKINGIFSRIIKLDIGYMLFNSENQTIYRLNEDGNILWDKISPNPSLTASYKVEDNNMLLQTSENHIIKMDSIGNELWDKTFQISIKNIMKHSSGNYLMTGIRDGHLAIKAINPDGDSISIRQYMEAKSKSSILKAIELHDGSIAILTSNLTLDPIQDTIPNQYVVTFDTLDLPLVSSTNHSEDGNSDLMVYPNPAKDFFTIKTDEKYTNLQLQCYNSLGQLIASHPLFSSNSTISTASWKSGQYFLNVIDGKGKAIQTFKLTVDR